MTPVLPIERARVLFDGIFTEPKLSHPEGVAIGPDGRIHAGNQDGDILAIAPDGSSHEVVASTGGFALGLAFDGPVLFVCDMRHACIVRIDLTTGAQDRWGAEGLRIPNYPVIDRARARLLVSDSHEAGRPGPGVWAFDLATGDASLWHDAPMHFANGLAMRAGEDALYACETFANAVTRIPILSDGRAGAPETFAADLPGLPDGIAFDREGSLVVGCYEPSRLLRLTPDGARCDLLIEDSTAHVLCHPTNVAFDGQRLITANLGRWHLTEIAMDVGAPALAP